jgi:hypothetical protein
MPAAWSLPVSSSLRYLLPVSKQCSLARILQVRTRLCGDSQLRNFATPAVSYKMFLYSHENFTKYFSKLQKNFPKALIEDPTDLAKKCKWIDYVFNNA